MLNCNYIMLVKVLLGLARYRTSYTHQIRLQSNYLLHYYFCVFLLLF